MPVNIGGIEVETVGDLISNGQSHIPPVRFEPARLEHSPPPLQPGIYFGMPDEVYHALPAFSATGVKKMAASSMLFWATTPWLNPEIAEREAKRLADPEERAHRTLGKAYHCRLLEGASVFAARFALALDKDSLGDSLLISTDDIKGAIALAGAAPITRVGIGAFVDNPRKAGEQKEVTRAAKKDDWIAQLLELDPAAQIWSLLEAAHNEAHTGCMFVTADQHRRIEIAAAMIERDDELRKALSGGHPEVVLIWYCPVTDIPMKAKVDYLKIRALVDLKSFGNARERSIERAIAYEIASYHYNIQPSVYFEGAAVVREVVRQHGASAVHVWGTKDEKERAPFVEWAFRWAQHRDPDKWLWIFQMAGVAPVTRGLWYPRGGSTKTITDTIVVQQKKKFRICSDTFGTDPWLDLRPLYDLADEDIPPFALEI